jgi:hypothetical protein
MSVDRQYTIQISVVADNSAAQRAVTELKAVGNATGEAADSAEELKAHGEQLADIVQEIARVAPAAGLALNALFGPPKISAGDVLTGLNSIKNALEQQARDAAASAVADGSQRDAPDHASAARPGRASEPLTVAPDAIRTFEGDKSMPAGDDTNQHSFGPSTPVGDRGIIEAVGKGFDANQHGQKLVELQMEQAAAFRVLCDLVGGNVLKILGIIRDSLAYHTSLQQQVDQLERQFSNLKAQSTRPTQ